MDLKHYEDEILPKGKAYLLVEKGPLEDLARHCRMMREKGAREIFIASKDPEYALADGPCGGVTLTYVHDMLGLTRELTPDRPRPEGRLTLEPLTQEKKEAFLQIYNESFFDVPNSATYADEEFEMLMGPKYRCGFALLDGAVVGIYELGFKMKNPEIGSIGLIDTARGKGLGRELLLTVMDHLTELGCEACWLQVSTKNRQAYPLYRSVGFGQDELLTRWYEVTEF